MNASYKNFAFHIELVTHIEARKVKRGSLGGRCIKEDGRISVKGVERERENSTGIRKVQVWKGAGDSRNEKAGSRTS